MNTKNSADLKAELLAMTEEAIEATLKWDEAHPTRTFDEIETFVLQARRRLGQRLAQALCEQQEGVVVAEPPRCRACGQVLRYKGDSPRQVGSLVSEVCFERQYYHCDHCESGGIFPPG
jgi:hypothetical protein